MKTFKLFVIIQFIFTSFFILSCSKESDKLHCYEIKEIKLYAENEYDNPYTDVECWIELKGPDTQKRLSAFWNGSNEFIVRIVPTKKGDWSYESQSIPTDEGLNGKNGTFSAVSWTDEELGVNPNRRGFLRSTQNGHALEYADGTPFFILGDTWWAASTWRYPLKGVEPSEDYIPNENLSFEELLSFRKRQGYNTIAMIAAFPNWKVDSFPAQFMNSDSIGVRQAWEKNAMNTAKDMHDENGNMPFKQWDGSPVIADFDHINPEYFKSLDKKIQYLNEQGFVTFLETVRRDHGPSWKEYFEWPESFSRYVQYIIARYGAYNIIFSGIHLDWINEHYCLPSDDFNEALSYHYNKYGGLPYGQPHTILIDGSTYWQFGHGEEAPWLSMHSVGNVPRNHGFYPMIEELFNLDPPYPAANMEPYYPGWDNEFHNTVAGERPVPDSPRDNYFGRTQMYGSVLSGGLAGHIFGTGAYDGNTTGEPKEEGDRPYIWEAMNYSSGYQMQFLGTFILSEGNRYQNCKPQRDLLIPSKTENSPENGLDGWSFLLLSPENDLGFLYFENKARIPMVNKLRSASNYELSWFDPENGEWLNKKFMTTNSEGILDIPSFPSGQQISSKDWALKIKLED